MATCMYIATFARTLTKYSLKEIGNHNDEGGLLRDAISSTAFRMRNVGDRGGQNGNQFKAERFTQNPMGFMRNRPQL